MNNRFSPPPLPLVLRVVGVVYSFLQRRGATANEAGKRIPNYRNRASRWHGTINHKDVRSVDGDLNVKPTHIIIYLFIPKSGLGLDQDTDTPPLVPISRLKAESVTSRRPSALDVV